MTNVYTVYGNDDGVIGVYGSWKKATVAAMDYCGDNAVEDRTDYSMGDDKDRRWDTRFFDGDMSGASISRWFVE